MMRALDILIKIYIPLSWFAEVYILYYIFLHIVGLLSHHQKYPIVSDKLKFCIFVPCHNEESVIAATVKNFSQIEYNFKLFEIYFIVDNCIDKTKEVLEKSFEKYKCPNFHALVRNEPDIHKRGKPHALSWGINYLEKKNRFYSAFDMFMVMDADNLVEPLILKHISSQYFSYKPSKRPAVIQTYLDSKNNKGLVAKGYFTTYRLMNGFWQLSKHKLHLVPGIGGTGFAIDIKVLENLGGFKCKSLTEDLEIQILITLKNKSIAYNSNVRVYDEKPTRVKAALVQRTRWAQGHWYLFFKYVPRLFLQLFNPKTFKSFFKKIDLIFHLTSRLFILASTLLVLLSIPIYIIAYIEHLTVNTMPSWLTYLNIALGVVSVAVIPLSIVYDGTKEEKKRILIDMIPNIISFYFTAILDMICGWIGLFKCHNQKVWKKTEHKIVKMSVNSMPNKNN